MPQNSGPTFFLGGEIGYPYLVYDTFTSSPTTLDLHTGEKGTPWIDGASTYVVSGGVVCPANGVSGTATFADGSSAFSDGYITITITV